MSHATLTCDPELLRRYDQPGPRYTSYPTAPQFGPHFQEDMLREYIHRSNEELIPRRLSLYVHVPYCSSPCFYCGCNRIITRDRTAGRRYVERLIREISLAGPLFDRDREVIQVHFGGGTPNFLRPEELRDVMRSLGQQFQLSNAPVRDFSIEIDPRFLNAADIAAYADMGLNRASLGVQDFDPAVQAAVNRVQSVQQTLAAIKACRRNGFRSINVDLIYGLPHQTSEGFGQTLDTVIGIRPHRLAVYGYAHMPHLFKPQRRIDASHLPNAEQRIALLCLAIEKLTGAGYVYIGMDHFALPEDDLTRAYDAGTLHRNFMGYTTHADCDLLGLGVSAISHIGDSFSQNPRVLPSWEAAVDSGHLPVWRGRHLDQDDQLRAEVIQQLMCRGWIDIAAVERRYDIDFHRYFADSLARLQPLVGDGLAVVERSRILATSRGRLLLRIIAMCFDRYLTAKPAAQAAQYSRAV
ncbi:MAG TPA: oxygen-independent coproporphyrinogen III oxidase [Steroidobacter sp.]|uniref:oxygen-independent coproporphyrinogen III oxidase n=1 Tax=Steroidobacter sp. TaxID=1978227 RepID=UPI002ED8E616